MGQDRLPQNQVPAATSNFPSHDAFLNSTVSQPPLVGVHLPEMQRQTGASGLASEVVITPSARSLQGAVEQPEDFTANSRVGGQPTGPAAATTSAVVITVTDRTVTKD